MSDPSTILVALPLGLFIIGAAQMICTRLEQIVEQLKILNGTSEEE